MQYIMTMDEATIAVQFYDRNLWKALAMMESDWDDLDSHDRSAYKMVKRELEKEMTNGN